MSNMKIYAGTLKSVPVSVSCESADFQESLNPKDPFCVYHFRNCREIRIKLPDFKAEIVIDGDLKLITDSPMRDFDFLTSPPE